MNEIVQVRQIHRWVVRERIPPGNGPHPLMLLIHGWTGDENSMWIFASRLPKHSWLVSPRAPYPDPQGGFSWFPHQSERPPSIQDFHPLIQELFELLNLSNFPQASFSGGRPFPLYLIGFSQGAALVYSFALLFPQWVTALAGLSGFLPEGSSGLVADQPLSGKPVFVAHGTRDPLVSIDTGRQVAAIMKQAGAQVTYCEDDVGHKLSANCFSGLDAFFVSVS